VNAASPPRTAVRKLAIKQLAQYKKRLAVYDSRPQGIVAPTKKARKP